MAGKVLDLDWRPMLRDAGFYLLSIVEFAVFSFSGNQVEWFFFTHIPLVCLTKLFRWEALIMLGTYAAYIIWMKYNTQIIKRFCPKPYDEHTDDGENGARPMRSGETELLPRRLSVTKMIHRLSQEGREEARLSASELPPPSESAGSGEAAPIDSIAEAVEEGEEDDNPWEMPYGLLPRVLWVASLPYMALFTFTVPKCKVLFFEYKKKMG